jgi:hypothetical protein
MQAEMIGGMNDSTICERNLFRRVMVLVSNIVYCSKDADQQTFRSGVSVQIPEEQRGASGFSHPHLKVSVLCWMIIMYERVRCLQFQF